MVTYPCTDSRFLTEDMEDTAQAVIKAITDTLEYKITEMPNIKPVMNNKKLDRILSLKDRVQTEPQEKNTTEKGRDER